MKATKVRPLALSVILGLFLLAAGCGPSGETRDHQESPASGADWQVIGPGGGGSTFYPTFSYQDPQRIIIRCDMTGTYLSADGGQSWKMFNFPGGARAFAFDPRDPDVVFVGAKGLHRTRDGGRNWELVFPRPDEIEKVNYLSDHADISYVVPTASSYPGPSASVSAILVDPDNPGLVYLGVNRPAPDGSAAGLFRSDDGGSHWAEVARLNSPAIGIFAGQQGSGRISIFCRNIMYSYDKNTGQTEQTPLPAGLAPVVSAAGGIDPESGGMRFYAVGETRWDGGGGLGKVYVSHDGARTWRELTEILYRKSGLSGKENSPSFRYVACSPLDSRTAYLVCNRFMDKNPRGEPGHWYGVFKTEDSGESWEWVYRAGGGSPDYTIRDGWKAENERDSWVREAFGGEFVAVICIGVFPANPEIAVFTDWYRAMKTTDGGRTWTELYSETQPDSSLRSRGLDVTTCYGVHFDPFDKNHIVISYTDIAYWHSFNGGKTWFRPVEGVPPAWDNTCYWVQFDPEIRDKLWSAWSSWHDIPKLKMIRSPRWRQNAVGGVCVSTDGGRTWKVSSNGLPGNSPTTSLVLNPDSPPNDRTLYAAVYGTGVFKSTDDGKSWQKKNKGLGDNLNAWEITLAGDGALYLVITNDIIHRGSGAPELAQGEVYRSADGAESWEKIALPARVKFPNSLTADPLSSNRLYLACWGPITVSDYRGDPGQGTTAGGKYPVPVIDSDGGVFCSEDAGQSWKSIFDKEAYVYALAVDSRHPGRLYLNTFNHAAWRSDDSGRSWKKLAGYDFHWGHRVIPDKNDPDKIYLTTFGGSVWHGKPVAVAESAQ